MIAKQLKKDVCGERVAAEHCLRRAHHLATVLSMICFGALVGGCDAAKARARAEHETVSRPLTTEVVVPKPPYPLGRWRLANPSTLEKVTLWVSHLLVRHEGAFGTQVCFGPPGWHAFPPPPRRTREEALSLAVDLATKVHASPERFAEFAREHSEDTVTRGTGGSLGGITASELLRTPEILDALAVLKPGEVSHVIETHCGFHVIQRRATPPDVMVSGARIVIGHDGAGWLRRFGARRPVPSRSRDQALKLATKVYKRARAHPDQFSELVSEHSEHRDAIDGGDLGEWSTHEASYMPREIEILKGLTDGEVAPPVEGLFGFAILRRTPTRPRKQFAMEAIQVFFDAEASDDDPMSKSTAFKTTNHLLHELVSDPLAWPRIHREHCCDGVQAWTQGRAPRALERLLEELTPGTVADRPIEWNSSFVIAMAINPSSVPTSAPIRHKLPAPLAADIDYISGWMHPSVMREALLAVCREMKVILHLSDHEARTLEELHDFYQVEQSPETYTSTETRQEAFARVQHLVEGRLGSKHFAKYRAILMRHLEKAVLSPDTRLTNRRLHRLP